MRAGLLQPALRDEIGTGRNGDLKLGFKMLLVTLPPERDAHTGSSS
jgi:hypothetical protein